MSGVTACQNSGGHIGPYLTTATPILVPIQPNKPGIRRNVKPESRSAEFLDSKAPSANVRDI
jgi:hypothetical protein